MPVAVRNDKNFQFLAVLRNSDLDKPLLLVEREEDQFQTQKKPAVGILPVLSFPVARNDAVKTNLPPGRLR